MAIGIEKGVQPINEIIIQDQPKNGYIIPFATSNPDKIKEIASILDIEPENLPVLNPHIEEIQSRSPDEVVKAKAKAAYEATGGTPVIVEDTSLLIPAVESKHSPTLVKFWAEHAHDRADIAEEVHKKGDTRALAQTKIAIFDGQKSIVKTGSTRGKIPPELQGEFEFGFDDMFIPLGQPEGQEKTFAEMTLQEKNEYSMRKKVLEDLKNDPFKYGIYVYAHTEALQMEIDAIKKEFFRGPEMEKARQHAYRLRVLGDMEPNENLEIDMNKIPPYHEIKLHEDITQYTHDPDSPDLGCLINGYDKREYLNGASSRMLLNFDDRPTFVQHGEKSLMRAVAARAYEFAIHHNPERYAELREMINGKRTAPRANKKSLAIEKSLGMLRSIKKNTVILSEEDIDSGDVFTVPGFTSLAYGRQYSDESLSRSKAADHHIINRNGIPTSIFSLGGMPPVTGSRDQVTTAAFSFMRSYISHNSLFVDFNRRLALFNESKQVVEDTINEEENTDIKDLVTRQIGVCVSGKHVDEIQDQSEQLINAGCRSLRIYTTNPGIEVPDAAEAICKLAHKNKLHKEQLPFHLCVGPVVDEKQAKKLQKTAKEYGVALTLLVGHGGGENCTSLEGGAAANAIEIMYNLSRDSKFNKVSLGFEGGLGTWFGPWMGIIDQISKNGDIVRGTVESQGGLCVLHKSGEPVQPYSGTASPSTQMTEQTLFPDMVQRTNPAGQLKNNEGRPNYMKASRWAQSMAHHFTFYRSVFGRVLADQQADSINRMMKNIRKHGFVHRVATSEAVATAKSHRQV